MNAPITSEAVDGAWAQSIKLAFKFLYCVVCVLAVAWLVSNFRQVPPDSRAMVLRFGGIVRQQGAGLLLAWPRPIEQILLLPTADRQIKLDISRFAPPGDVNSVSISVDPRENTGFFLTGDFGVVHLQATLFYQITDPNDYLVSETHIAAALERMFIASAVKICAERDIDAILVARPEATRDTPSGSMENGGNTLLKREQLRSDLVSAVNRRLADLTTEGAGLGVSVSRVDLNAALSSTAQMAFDMVLRYSQRADQNIASARTDAERTAQAANQEHDRILTEAEATAQERITKATSRTAAIVALIPQLKSSSGQALANGIYFDRMNSILKQTGEVFGFDTNNGMHLILPGGSQ